MKIKKIFLDMDGVLCDFDKRYDELFGPERKDRDNKEFSKNWKYFINSRQFEFLEYFEGAERLIQYVSTLSVRVEILSSSGGAKTHSDVRNQKVKWLQDRNIKFPVNIVPGRKVKKFYATKDSILIDDTLDVIESFRDAGGIAIHHKNDDNTKTADITIEKLKEYSYE